MTDCHVMLHPDWFYRQMRSLNFPTTKLIRTKFYSALKKKKAVLIFLPSLSYLVVFTFTKARFCLFVSFSNSFSLSSLACFLHFSIFYCGMETGSKIVLIFKCAI